MLTMLNNRALIILIFVLLSSAKHVHAQTDEQNDLILVELKTETNRINYYKNTNPAEVPVIEKDAARVRELTILDFKRHFNKYPVYYFIDTNLNDVIQKKFQQSVLDSNMQPVNLPGSSHFKIVYYGYPQNDSGAGSAKDFAYDNTERAGKGLVIMTEDFKYYDYIMGHGVSDDPRIAKYCFSAKKYDIEYAPLAYKLSKHIK